MEDQLKKDVDDMLIAHIEKQPDLVKLLQDLIILGMPTERILALVHTMGAPKTSYAYLGVEALLERWEEEKKS